MNAVCCAIYIILNSILCYFVEEASYARADELKLENNVIFHPSADSLYIWVPIIALQIACCITDFVPLCMVIEDNHDELLNKLSWRVGAQYILQCLWVIVFVQMTSVSRWVQALLVFSYLILLLIIHHKIHYWLEEYGSQKGRGLVYKVAFGLCAGWITSVFIISFGLLLGYLGWSEIIFKDHVAWSVAIGFIVMGIYWFVSLYYTDPFFGVTFSWTALFIAIHHKRDWSTPKHSFLVVFFIMLSLINFCLQVCIFVVWLGKSLESLGEEKVQRESRNSLQYA